jgi:hypothetical protein
MVFKYQNIQKYCPFLTYKILQIFCESSQPTSMGKDKMVMSNDKHYTHINIHVMDGSQTCPTHCDWF